MSNTGETLRERFNKIVDLHPPFLPGLSIGKFVRDIDAEIGRLAVQGRAELAQALFSGSNAYVPYGQGQRAPDQQRQIERGGR